MTERYELVDATVRDWDAVVLASGPDGVVLDRSAFYPGGGGQPPDHGVLLWAGVRTRVVGSRRGDDVVLVVHEEDPVPPVGTAVRGALDDAHRTALMRTHSALHVLSAVVHRDFAARVTGSGMQPLLGRMDFNLAEVPPDFRTAVEDACNAAIAADHRVEVRFVAATEAAALPELSRSEESHVPEGLEIVRLVDIVGLDTQADAGTHVASTAQIGAVRVTKLESKGRGFRRVRLAVEN
ncbi:alanyl-tRNA editing protein [Blastococcus sp. TF02A-35]|uniref:alanyl-tRNA editing protein n=1 Tax=Blastococcus sp. TF02A-35 TaxID=2559612 RepID=UPI001072F9B3|nr:alanyl-tRNA editing protein [Blastococcus sp. TF02A_35]TFV52519.1 alanyl-tRNA editing protein [Blastococcus sp. TF02A_35]